MSDSCGECSVQGVLCTRKRVDLLKLVCDGFIRELLPRMLSFCFFCSMVDLSESTR